MLVEGWVVQKVKEVLQVSIVLPKAQDLAGVTEILE